MNKSPEIAKSREKSSSKRMLKAITTLALAEAAVFFITNNTDALGRLKEAYDGSSSTESSVSSFVSKFIHDEVKVICESQMETFTIDGNQYNTLGYVEPIDFIAFSYIPPVMTLSAETCDDIANLATSRQIDLERAFSLAVATHEYEHIAENSSDEAQVQCLSIARLAPRLMDIGLSESDAVTFTKQVATSQYRTQPSDYKNPSMCRPGGSYTVDLELSGVKPIVYNNPDYLE